MTRSVPGGFYSLEKDIKIVTLYSKPGCVQCVGTERRLKARDINYKYVDVSQDADALAKIKELGYMQAPVVVTDTDHWSGFRPDKIDSL